MPQITQYLSRRLTARQTVVLVVIAALLGGLGYGAYKFVGARMLEARVNAAIPEVCSEIREERDQLISAIEAYKAQFGAYPPDHVLNRQPLVVDPVTNTLFYELVGVIYNPTNKMFEISGQEAAEEEYVKEFLQCDGFKNCAQTPDQIIRFLKADPLPWQQLHDDPDVFVAGFQVRNRGLDPEMVWEFEATPWRYVSSAPTNNPGKFDLWMELKTKHREILIGNWKAVE